jgi:hypothetical protein
MHSKNTQIRIFGFKIYHLATPVQTNYGGAAIDFCGGQKSSRRLFIRLQAVLFIYHFHLAVNN